MTTEQLLQPRFEVIADYPDSRYKVGEILDRDWGWNGDDVDGFNNKISDYPHLFRKLQWWEKRKVEDMPMYVKVIAYENNIKSREVKPVVKVELHNIVDGFHFKDTEGRYCNYDICIPSTEEEYLEFKNNP